MVSTLSNMSENKRIQMQALTREDLGTDELSRVSFFRTNRSLLLLLPVLVEMARQVLHMRDANVAH